MGDHFLFCAVCRGKGQDDEFFCGFCNGQGWDGSADAFSRKMGYDEELQADVDAIANYTSDCK